MFILDVIEEERQSDHTLFTEIHDSLFYCTDSLILMFVATLLIIVEVF